jgi:pyruvate,water dikinase
MKFVIDLRDSDDASLVGGKAAWLGRLLRAGINVPDGFVVTVAKDFSEDNRAEILRKFDELGAEKVAVRSSGANEDGAEKSFAGQFDTFLNVGRDDLIEKLYKVFGSANSARAQNYSSESSNGGFAVVVQTMIQSDISGVAFSANPITNNHDEIMIEVVNGLGEKLVSGLTTPDLFVINKNSGEVLTHETSAEKVDLADENLNELTEAVRKIEDLAGCPVDIEWAIAKNQLYILQTRPITTLNKGEENGR